MDNKKKIALLLMIVLIALTIVFEISFNIGQNNNKSSIKFKKEYESLNGKSSHYENKSYKYLNVKIDKNNNVEYLEKKDVVNKLTSGTQIIYFGNATCNWCRAAIPVLLDTTKDNGIEKIYYFDFFELREKYKNDKSKEDTKIYEEIIKVLDKYIDTTFNDDSNKKDKKMLTAPLVVFVKNGEVVGVHKKTVASHKEYTKNLNKKQKEELKNIYQQLIDKMQASVCTIDHEC